MESTGERSITLQLAALAAARLALNTGLRFVYPFAPAMARGLGVPLSDIYYLITLRNMTGFLSPVFGPLSESYGRRAVLVVGMLIFAAGTLLVGVWPFYWVLGLSLCATGIAKILYDPAMQAYVGDVVPYQQRGRAVAITEYSWSLALLVGVPLVGIAIQRTGWQSPFLWLGASGLLAAFILWRIIADGERKPRSRAPLAAVFTVLRQHLVVVYAATYIILFVAANEMLFIVFGSWMERSFRLSLTTLGVASAVIGGAELLGETIAGFSVDRFGKRPVIIFTGLLTALCNFLLPYLGTSLTGALITLFVLFMAFEITIVGGIPLMTELVPGSRAVVMSVLLAAMFSGRTIGSLIGPVIWNQFGAIISGVVWATVTAVAVAVLAFRVKEET